MPNLVSEFVCDVFSSTFNGQHSGIDDCHENKSLKGKIIRTAITVKYAHS